LIHHGAEIPEEWPGAKLTVVGLHPAWNFFPHRVHFPENNYRVFATAYQLLGLVGVGQGSNFVAA